MQPSVPVAPPTPAVASLQPLPLPTAPVVAGKMTVAPMDFGGELAKLLTGATATTQSAKPTDAPSAAANPATEPQAPALAPPMVLAPAPAPPMVLAPAPAPTQASIQLPEDPPGSPALLLPEAPSTAPPVVKPGNGPRESPPRRGAPPRAAALDTGANQPPVPTIAPVSAVAVATPERGPERTAPAAPGQRADVPAAPDGVSHAPTEPIAARPTAPKPALFDATPPTSSSVQAAAVAAPGQIVLASQAELTAQVPPDLPEPVAQSTPPMATAAAPEASPHAAPPAAQIAPALVQLGHAPDGAQRLTVRLDPPELGHVQVRIDRLPEAPARVEITVEKAETLTLLLRDQPQLQRALDQAGVPAEGRAITFHIASPESAARSEPATSPAPGVAADGSIGDGAHGAPRNGGRQGQPPAVASDDANPGFTPIALAGWARGGLDITA